MALSALPALRQPLRLTRPTSRLSAPLSAAPARPAARRCKTVRAHIGPPRDDEKSEPMLTRQKEPEEAR